MTCAGSGIDQAASGTVVTYNPRKAARFYEVETGAPVEHASRATVTGKYVYVTSVFGCAFYNMRMNVLF